MGPATSFIFQTLGIIAIIVLVGGGILVLLIEAIPWLIMFSPLILVISIGLLIDGIIGGSSSLLITGIVGIILGGTGTVVLLKIFD